MNELKYWIAYMTKLREEKEFDKSDDLKMMLENLGYQIQIHKDEVIVDNPKEGFHIAYTQR